MPNTNAFINFFTAHNVPMEMVLLILMLPLVATLIAFFRQIVGIKAFGIYTPLIITFAFMAIGIKYGIAIFIAVIFLGMLTRFILKPFRLLYLPRVAIMLTLVALVILGILLLGGSFKKTSFSNASILPILIIITLVEKFITVQIEKGGKTAITLAVETLIISIVGFFVINSSFLRNFLLAYPWIVLFTLPVNIILGKWTGLRLSEYIRFRHIIKKMS
jgi:hypothetical protein